VDKYCFIDLFAVTKACQSWYDEIKDYNFDNHGFAMNTGKST